MPVISMAVLASFSASAGENAFKADLDNSTISTVISEFENVCFPFISHETELSAEQDRAVFQSRMVEAGYELGEEKNWKGPWEGFNYSPTICDDKADGKGGRSCEMLLVVQILSARRTYLRQQFNNTQERSLSANLEWTNEPLFSKSNLVGEVNTPAIRPVKTYRQSPNSCGIHLYDKNLTADLIQSAIIDRDLDWEKGETTNPETQEIISDAHHWKQCATLDRKHYLYSASLIEGALSMKVETLQDEESPSYNCKSATEEG